MTRFTVTRFTDGQLILEGRQLKPFLPREGGLRGFSFASCSERRGVEKEDEERG